jgi:hypothetical protein
MKYYKFYWHIHHDILVELLTEPLENRVKYIKENKPKNEVGLRLKLLKPVKGKLPNEVIKTTKACDKAWKAYNKAWKACVKTGKACVKTTKACDKAWKAYNKAEKAYNKAWEAYQKVLKDNMPAIEKLHKSECKNCPWNGKSIFP